MRVALTGANGFTGKYVRHALTNFGIPYVILKGDLRNPRDIRSEIERNEFDRLIHLAGSAFVGATEWESFYQVNLIGTLSLLDALAETKPGIRCILASSAQVYGSAAEGLVKERTLCCPSNHYAISKWSMEQAANLWRDRLEITVTRPFNYTGVGQTGQYLIPKIVDHFHRRAEVIELGNTWVKRDFSDVRSVADAYVGLALTDTPPPLVNICTGHLHSIDDILRYLKETSGHDIAVRVNPDFVRTNDIEVLGGDPTLLSTSLKHWRPNSLQDLLGWMYETGLSEARER
ncbi:MAG: GDP-mannose 4,6-dehydratase [Erythrobacter sp.]|nr:GDP-mannose 4,6-dehydratase [Erythrobacter sp.]